MQKKRYLGDQNKELRKKRKQQQRTFEPAKLDSAHSGKMTKRKDGQKVNHKEHDIKRNPEQKSQSWLSKKQHQKEEKMRNKERLGLLEMGTKQALVHMEQNRGINGSPGLQINTIKKGKSNRREQWNHSEKNSVKKLKENREYLPVSQKQPLQHILRFKMIQTLQVLEAWIAIKVCNFLAYLNLVSRLSEHIVTIIKEN